MFKKIAKISFNVFAYLLCFIIVLLPLSFWTLPHIFKWNLEQNGVLVEKCFLNLDPIGFLCANVTLSNGSAKSLTFKYPDTFIIVDGHLYYDKKSDSQSKNNKFKILAENIDVNVKDVGVFYGASYDSTLNKKAFKNANIFSMKFRDNEIKNIYVYV